MAERKRYVHLFETVSEFNAAYEGEDYHEPWVSYVKEQGNERVDYNKSPLPVRDDCALFNVVGGEGGKVYFINDNLLTPESPTYYVSYDGESWSSVTYNQNKVSVGYDLPVYVKGGDDFDAETECNTKTIWLKLNGGVFVRSHEELLLPGVDITEWYGADDNGITPENFDGDTRQFSFYPVIRFGDSSYQIFYVFHNPGA